MPELSVKTQHNKCPFYLLEHIPAVGSLISDRLSTVHKINDVPVPYDGLLFYHKESTYVSGFTPLVVWLKPFMVPEIFNVSVDPEYMERRPKNYTTYLEHINTSTSARSKKKTKIKNENITDVSLLHIFYCNILILSITCSEWTSFPC